MLSKPESNFLNTAILWLQPGTWRLRGAVFSSRFPPWRRWSRWNCLGIPGGHGSKHPQVRHCSRWRICSHGLSAGAEVWTALPGQWGLLLERVSEVLGRHQEAGRLGQVDRVARGVRWGRWGNQAAWLCPGKGEPPDGAPRGAGAGGRAGLPGRCPEVRRSQDHGEGLRLIAAEWEADWLLRGLLRSQAGAAINSHQRAQDDEGDEDGADNQEGDVDRL